MKPTSKYLSLRTLQRVRLNLRRNLQKNKKLKKKAPKRNQSKKKANPNKHQPQIKRNLLRKRPKLTMKNPIYSRIQNNSFYQVKRSHVQMKMMLQEYSIQACIHKIQNHK